jgi:hypothetical protein
MPLAVQLLRILSCFAPDAFPRDALNSVDGAPAVERALGILASYNMTS